MKILSVCGLAATIMIVGVLIYTLWSAMLYLAWAVIAGGALAGLIALFRFWLPGHIRLSDARHERWKSTVDLQLRQRMLAIAERPGYQARFDANGSIELIPSSYATHATLPPALHKQQEGEQDEEAEQDIPASVRYEDIADQIPEGHSCLGVSANGLETCDFRDLMTMLISGGSSTGKSNTVAIKLHEAIQLGRNTRMIVIDPHKNKPDSLYNKIHQYESRFLCPVAQKDEEIIHALKWFKQEFDRRMELSTDELEALDDILLVCDEVYALVYHREDERIKKLIKLVSGIAGYESRGYGMYAWFLTQKVTGLKWLRDAVMTTICHKMQTMSERVLASNDDRSVARDMDNWTMKGRVVVFGLNLPVTVAQMPLFVPLDEERTTGTFFNSMAVPEEARNALSEVTEPLDAPVPGVPPALQNSASEREKIPSEERERIIDLALSGVPRREMCRALGRGNGYYDVVKTVLNEEGL